MDREEPLAADRAGDPLVVSIGGAGGDRAAVLPEVHHRAGGRLKPYTPLRLAGRDIYVREGCYNCHSQMIRPFRAETERYGHYSVAGEFVYDRPFQWGSASAPAPTWHRVGGRYSDEWHRIHLNNPRDVVPESNMPAYPWLAKTKLDAAVHRAEDARAARLGVPYTDRRSPPPAGAGRQDREDALVAYLQGLGTGDQDEELTWHRHHLFDAPAAP
jgi:cytochrome c oxidase cbb3-type subunit 2